VSRDGDGIAIYASDLGGTCSSRQECLVSVPIHPCGVVSSHARPIHPSSGCTPPPQQPTISIRSTDHIHYAARGSMKVGCDDTLGRAQRCQLHRFITSAGDLRRRGCSGASWTA